MIIKQASTIDRRRLLQCGAAAWMSASLDEVVRGVSALAAEPNRASAVPAEAQTTFGRAKSVIWLFLQGFTALIKDLASRGLLDETLVVAIGEMGRTPKVNASGGRDHWGNVFSFVLAGAGIRPGQVLGASDRQGAYPARDRVSPSELTATILNLLGIGHEAAFPDRTGRPLRATEGEPLWTLLG